MDLDRLKAKRTTARKLFTQLVNKIDGILEIPISDEMTEREKADELSNLKLILIEKLDNLKGLDKEIEDLVEISELEREITSSDLYWENGITCRNKIERCVRHLENVSNVPPQSALVHTDGEIELGNLRMSDAGFSGQASGIRHGNDQIKLPRFTIANFDGDCCAWLDFWNSFEVAIHNNRSLSQIEKFVYLKTYLKGTALTAVTGFALTEGNYDSCIQLLKERFGRSDLIVSSHMNKLLSIEPVRSASNIAALRRMYDFIQVQVRSLESLGVSAGTFSNVLCPVILQKIPEEINLIYNRQRKSTMLFDINDLIDFLRREIECRESSSLLGNQKFSTKDTQSVRTPINSKFRPSFNQKQNFSTASTLVATAGSKNCIFCSKTHVNQDCTLSVKERKTALSRQGRCFICLGRRHVAKTCWKRNPCNICKLMHHPLICESETPPVNSTSLETMPQSENSLFCSEKKQNTVLLQTFTAMAKTRRGTAYEHEVRCLCDGGSTRSFVKKETAEKLGLATLRREPLLIYAFGSKAPGKQTYDVVELVLQNRTAPRRKIKVEAIVIDSITLGRIEVPSQWVRNVALEKGFELADVGNTEDIHVLIGSDYLWEVLGEKNVRLSKRLIATDSIFGYVIQGKEKEINCHEVQVSHLTVVRDELAERVKDLWDLEAIGIKQGLETSQRDKDVLEKFEQNTTFKEGRYETRLLWKDDCGELGSNYGVARRRLFSLNGTFRRKEEFYMRYRDIIREQERNGIVEHVESRSSDSGEVGYFMPHHGVVRELKETTKVRICYDASSKSKGQLSLNDCLDSGPNLNPDLLEIVLKFRYPPVAFCADIQSAFLEIGIAEEDRKYLQFLWGEERENSLNLRDRDIKILRMRRVPFGVKCSPFLLAATIRLHLRNYESTHKDSYDVLNQLYVDDLISGAETVEKAAQISKDATKILSEASMNLRQWVTNSSELREAWKEAQLECRKSKEESGVPLKILGLIWDNDFDTLKIATDHLCKLDNAIPTKRLVLSTCGMLFDPLGLMTPFTVRIKLIMQKLWKSGYEWDEPLPPDIASMFREWLKEIQYVQNIVIPRPYYLDSKILCLELHIFSDASQKAYGCVAYFRILYQDRIETAFVISKSRLAPLKQMTLPRLELLGALLSARLSLYLRKTFPRIEENNIYYWCDSQICLHWLRGPPDGWKQFVRNRVCEIKEKTDPRKWKFCSGKENPADRLTRGISARSLSNDSIWWTGPSWLSEAELPSGKLLMNPSEGISEVDDEKRGTHVLLQTCNPPETLFDLTKFSDLDKILRITSYVMRFVNNVKPKAEKRSGALTAEELSYGERFWIRATQRTKFGLEYSLLKDQKSIQSGSPLFALNPAMTDDGIIYLGGRLQHSGFEFHQKHPLILPAKSPLTKLMIEKAHRDMSHAGVSDTLTQLRERYWILRGRQAVKSCINKCLICKRLSAKPGRQVVAPLPADRMEENCPFDVVGIDFAGPLHSRDHEKVYVALFTCAVTRAIHLELVTNLSAENFLLALRRFVARRGVPRVIHSDNALTFKRADSELQTLYENLSDSRVQSYLGKKGIKWKYIVERAAWWGGYWERMVRILKCALKKILGRSLVSAEELQTILNEVEAMINSRPLTYVYNEPSEPFPLTPSNFLVGKRLTALPQWTGNPQYLSSKRVLIKRFLHRERLLNLFWKRWREEYLLQLRSVHCHDPINVSIDFNINDVVLIGDDKAPRQTWRLGRVIEIHRGRDNKVRSVTLKTSTGVLKRPVQLLYNLELDNK